MTRGRKALINRPDIKHPAHLDLLDEVQREVVRHRWGIATGRPLTQEETADLIGTNKSAVNTIEHSAAETIIAHLQSTPRVTDDELKIISRIERLEHAVATLRADVIDAVDAVAHLTRIVDEHTNTLDAMSNKKRWVRRLR